MIIDVFQIVAQRYQVMYVQSAINIKEHMKKLLRLEPDLSTKATNTRPARYCKTTCYHKYQLQITEGAFVRVSISIVITIAKYWI